MSTMTVDAALCLKDGVCVAVCPTRSLVAGAERMPVEFHSESCIECGQCMSACSTGAIRLSGLPVEAFEPLPQERPTSEQIDGLMKSRRSVRVFRDKPVSRETIAAVLDVARRAPSAKNVQDLDWIVMAGRDKVRELAREMIGGILPEKARPALMAQWNHGADLLLRGAPAVVLACAPVKSSWGADDAAIALAYFELAAEARGLGVCWAGYLKRVASSHEPVIRMLNVPEGYIVRGALMVGEGLYRYRRVPPRKALRVQWM